MTALDSSVRVLIFVGTVCSLMVLGVSNARAEIDDKLRLTLGGYSIYRYDSTISLTAARAGIGVSFSPEDTLGLDSEGTVFRADGRYRFNDTHSMTMSWYRISSDGARVLDNDIEYGLRCRPREQFIEDC